MIKKENTQQELFGKEIARLKEIIEDQQKEIKKEKSRIMELAELLDKQENEIKFLKGELEIQEGCSINKDKIREIFQFYIERDSLFNDNPHKMAVIRLKDVLEELLEEQ